MVLRTTDRSFVVTDAPRPFNSLTTSRCPCCAAKNMGVQPVCGGSLGVSIALGDKSYAASAVVPRSVHPPARLPIATPGTRPRGRCRLRSAAVCSVPEGERIHNGSAPMEAHDPLHTSGSGNARLTP